MTSTMTPSTLDVDPPDDGLPCNCGLTAQHCPAHHEGRWALTIAGAEHLGATVALDARPEQLAAWLPRSGRARGGYYVGLAEERPSS